MNAWALIGIVGLALAVEAAEYSTLPRTGAHKGYTLSITEHPGLCGEAGKSTCVGTTAPVYDWPVGQGDRVVVAADDNAVTRAVVQFGDIYVPVDIDPPAAQDPVTIQVFIEPAPRLLISHAGTESTLDVVVGEWLPVPLPDSSEALFLRLDAPAGSVSNRDATPRPVN